MFRVLLAFVAACLFLSVASEAQAAPRCANGVCTAEASDCEAHRELFPRDGDRFLGRAARATGEVLTVPFRAARSIFDGHRLRKFRENRPRLVAGRGCH